MFSRQHIGAVAALVVVGLVAAGVLVVGDEQPVAPTVTQPAPRGLDDQGDLRLIRQTPTRIVLGWTPELTGYGYLFSGDDTVVARTTDPARSTATFRNIYTSYEVAAIDKGDTGTYSPLAGTLTMTVTAETANTITFGWTPQAEYGYLFSGDGDVISRTYDPGRSYAKFNKSYTDYEVAVLVKGVTGTYPPPEPPLASGCELPNYPDATCTGVPEGTELTDSGGFSVTQDGTTVNALNISGTLSIDADNVTVTNSFLQRAISINGTGLVIRDTTITCEQGSGGPPKGIHGPSEGDFASNFRAYRIDLSDCEDGCFCGENFQVRDSYFHDPYYVPPGPGETHNDGFQVEYGGDTVIDHNYISWVDTSAIAYCTNLGCTIGANVLIRNNLLEGAGWTMYCPQVSTTNYTIVGNRWVDGSSGFGPGTNCAGEIQLDNRLQTAGTIVNLDGTPITDCPLPAFPNGTCAGVPAGVSLTSSGSLNITTPGTVINGLDITGSVTVNAPDVIIANSRITNRDFAVIQNNSTNLQVWNSELINLAETGENRCHNGIQENHFLLDKVEITGCENAINIESPGNVYVFGTYIHDLDTVGPSYIWGNDPHTDGVQINGGSANVLFIHTGIDPVGSVVGVGGTSAVIMDVGASPPHNSDTIIEDSYLDGRDSAYALYAPRVTTTGILINDNKMYSGDVGYTDCVKVGDTVAEFNNNRDAGTDALISADEGAGQACED